MTQLGAKEPQGSLESQRLEEMRKLFWPYLYFPQASSLQTWQTMSVVLNTRFMGHSNPGVPVIVLLTLTNTLP